MSKVRKRSGRRRRSRRGLHALLLVLGVLGLLIGFLLVAVFLPRGLWRPVKLGVVYVAIGLGLLGLYGLMIDSSKGIVSKGRHGIRSRH